MAKKEHTLTTTLGHLRAAKELLAERFGGDEAERVKELLALCSGVAGSLAEVKPEDTTGADYYALKDEFEAFAAREGRFFGRAGATIQAMRTAKGFHTSLSPAAEALIGRVIAFLLELAKERFPTLERMGRGLGANPGEAPPEVPAAEGEEDAEVKPKKPGKRHQLG